MYHTVGVATAAFQAFPAPGLPLPPPGLLLATTRPCNRLAEALAPHMLEKKVSSRESSKGLEETTTRYPKGRSEIGVAVMVCFGRFCFYTFSLVRLEFKP